MAGRGKAHSLKGCQISFMGIPIVGFGEDGSIEIEPVSDAGELVEGADGEESIFCFNHSNNFTATVQLAETARSVFLLDLQFDVQRNLAAAGVPAVPSPFLFRNPQTGESVKTDYAFFMTQPSRGAARKSGVREYKFSLLNVKRGAPTLNLV